MIEGKIEDALHTERDFLAAVLERVSSLVVVLNPWGQIVLFNRACEETTGYAFTEAKGKYFWDLCGTPEEGEFVKGVFEQLGSEPFPRQWENHWVSKDGNRRRIAWSNEVLENTEGAIEYIVSTGIAIAQSQQPEAALRDGEERLRLALDAAHMGTWDWNLVTETLTWSANQEQIYGMIPGSFEGTHVAFLAMVHPHDCDRVIQALQSAIDAREEYDIEFSIITPDGEMRWIRSKGQVFYNDTGTPVRMAGVDLDISKRKQAAAALQDRERFIQQVTDATPCIIYIYDFIDNVNIYINDQSSTIIGYTPAEIQQLGSEFLPTIMHPDDLVNLAVVYQQFVTLQDGEVIETEYRMRHKNGEWRWFLSRNLVFLRNANGLPQQILGTAQDISDRKRAEAVQMQLIASLQESEQRFRCLLDQARDGIFLINSDGWFVEVNQRACQDLGYTYQELVTLGLWDLDPTWFQKRFTELFSQQQALNADDTVEAIIKRKDGSTFPVEIRVGLLEWNQQQYLLALVRDITKRKRGEQVQNGLIEFLQESDERFRQMAENIRDIFWMRQVNPLQMLYISPAYEEIWGRSCSSWYEHPGAFLNAVHPEDRVRVVATLAQQMQGDSTDLEYRIIQPERSLRWIHERAFPILNHSGEVYRVTGIAEDITERKLAQVALQQAKVDLENKVRERTAELSLTNEQLRQEIIERQQAELALAESQQQLELFFSQSLDGFFFMMLDQPVQWDRTIDKEKALDYVFSHQRITKANHAFLAQYGATLEQLLGLTPNDLFAHNLVYGRSVWKQFFDAGRLHIETDERKLDGTQMWIEGDYICLYDEQGRLVGHFGVQRDVSERQAALRERKLAEAALRESEERFRQLAENIQSVFWMTDSDKNQTMYVSPAYEKIWGRTRQELYESPNSFLEAIHPEDRDRVIAALAKQVRGEYDEEYRIIQPDGSIRWICDRAFPIRDEAGNVYRITGIAEDISDRKQAEQALQESQRRYTLAVSAGKVGVWDWNLETNEIYLDPILKAMLGYADAEIPNQIDEWVKFVHPDDREKVAIAATANVQGLTSEYIIEHRMLHKDGTIRWFLARGTTIRDASGNAKRMMGTDTDITDRKLAEEETRNALAKEKELSELKSRFITMASHEFRTPLSTILSSADLLEYYLQDKSTEKELEHIQRIQTACLNMTQLLNDILLIGRAEAGKMEFNPAPLNLEQFCQDLVEEMQLSAGSTHQLVFNLGTGKKPHVLPIDQSFPCVDEKLLRGILNNLLSNAIKYSVSGGSIYLKLFYQDRYAVFQVEDRGIGIPKEDREHLFKPFHRAKNIGTISGTGLGLAIVKRSVELHGGKITFKSKIGVGTRFTVTLPCYSNCKL